MNIVLDMHGIIFCHSSNFSVEDSSKRFQEELGKYTKEKGTEMSQKEALEIELDSISKGLNDKSNLQIYFIPEALKVVKEIFSNGNQIIVISTSKVETSKLILDKLFKEQNIDQKTFFIDYYNTDKYGSKKDENMWKEILGKYKQISYLFEDKEQNLEAAQNAVKSLGLNTICKNSLIYYQK